MRGGSGCRFLTGVIHGGQGQEITVGLWEGEDPWEERIIFRSVGMEGLVYSNLSAKANVPRKQKISVLGSSRIVLPIFNVSIEGWICSVKVVLVKSTQSETK